MLDVCRSNAQGLDLLSGGVVQLYAGHAHVVHAECCKLSMGGEGTDMLHIWMRSVIGWGKPSCFILLVVSDV